MITISGLTKRYGEVQAVQDLSLCFPQRSVTIIHGPSGGGKTTLLRLIAGLEIPDAGEIRIGEKLASTPEGLLAPSKRGIGFVFQSSSLWPHLTVAQNILYGLHGLTKQQRQNYAEDHDAQTAKLDKGENNDLAHHRKIPSGIFYDKSRNARCTCCGEQGIDKAHRFEVV